MDSEPTQPDATPAGPALTGAPGTIDEEMQRRAERWASTMRGHGVEGIALAHADSWAGPGSTVTSGREAREELERRHLAPLASQSHGGGDRAIDEAPDPTRTCFERDRDRIYHASAFRRLAGKTQVFLFPEDHQRTRLTHALEVAQIARSVAGALGLNATLTEAIAIGHDCGHGPGGHASEDALSPFLADGFDHATWGADVTLVPLNLCAQTLDGVRNHSWSRPAPATPEGEVVSWADRIAYVCHDFEDAVATGVVLPEDLPPIVLSRVGATRSQQLGAFIQAMIAATAATGRIGMIDDVAEALAAFRRFNYEQIYMRPASRDQARSVIELLRSLVYYYLDHPELLRAVSGDVPDVEPSAEVAASDVGSDTQSEAGLVGAAVGYVAGMTDRFAYRQGVELLGWDPDRLPLAIV